MQKLVKKYTDLPIQVKASMWFFVCAFLQKGISFITTPIFTRLLRPRNMVNTMSIPLG